jgi:hypothetical protein
MWRVKIYREKIYKITEEIFTEYPVAENLIKAAAGKFLKSG